MIRISSRGGLIKEMHRLSRTLKCGESVKLTLSNYMILTSLPEVAMRYGLSFIDAMDMKNGEVVVTIINRFGRECIEGVGSGSGQH